ERLELVLFFFSRRRRHTSFSRDWSADVCSSDLALLRAALERRGRLLFRLARTSLADELLNRGHMNLWSCFGLERVPPRPGPGRKIGRASCRGRVARWGVGGTVDTTRDDGVRRRR